MKEKVLLLLKEAPGGTISGEALSRTLGISRAAVWKAVEQLRRDGCEITALPGRGYRLIHAPELLSAARIAAYLPGHAWSDRIQVLDTVDSTNTFLKRLAVQGAPEGTCVIARQQTAGRGRRGRNFYSPEDEGLYLSVLLRPRARAHELMHLTAMTAVAASRAVESVCDRRPGIKWTNDLVFGTRKLAGILTELSVVAETMEAEYVVVGIGVNCAQTAFPEELAAIATSLQLECGAPPNRARLAAALIREFSCMADELLSARAAWLAEFSAHCVTLGRDVRILRADSESPAHADGIGTEGELLVTYPDGTHGAVNSGEVSVRGMYGYL